MGTRWGGAGNSARARFVPLRPERLRRLILLVRAPSLSRGASLATPTTLLGWLREPCAPPISLLVSSCDGGLLRGGEHGRLRAWAIWLRHPSRHLELSAGRGRQRRGVRDNELSGGLRLGREQRPPCRAFPQSPELLLLSEALLVVLPARTPRPTKAMRAACPISIISMKPPLRSEAGSRRRSSRARGSGADALQASGAILTLPILATGSFGKPSAGD